MKLQTGTCVLLLSLLALPAFAQSEPNLEAQVDAYVKPYVETGNFSGAILIARQGKVLFSKGYGMANREWAIPNTPETRFQIASVSKPFTAAAIFMLQQQGKLSIQDPLSKFVPDYPQGDLITLDHLLSHTSGVPNVNQFPEYDEKARSPLTLTQVVALFKDKPLDFQPGEKYSYSNSNYNLLAFVIEKVSGMEYGEFLRRNIFTPLGMNDTGQPLAGQILLRRASGYVPVGMTDVEASPYLDWSIKTGNGSLYSTVEDLYKFDRALYGDGILGAASRGKSFSEHAGVGYGWSLRKNRLGRTSVGITGRSPGFSSSLERFLADDVCIVMLSNLYSSLTANLAEDLAAFAFGEKPPAPALLAPASVSPQVVDALVGQYQLGEDFSFQPNLKVVITRKGEFLLMEMGQVQSYLIPQSDTVFVDRVYGGKVTFVRDEAGTVTHLLWNFGRDYQASRIATSR